MADDVQRAELAWRDLLDNLDLIGGKMCEALAESGAAAPVGTIAGWLMAARLGQVLRRIGNLAWAAGGDEYAEFLRAVLTDFGANDLSSMALMASIETARKGGHDED